MTMEEEYISEDDDGGIDQEDNENIINQNKRPFPDIDEASTHGALHKKQRKLKKENETKKLQKPPTVEELNRLRETENLFHSNLFRRQIEEMLKELEMKDKLKVRINIWFDKLKEWLEKIEDSDEKHDLSNFDWLKGRKIKLPLGVARRATKGTYRFKKPSNIRLVGSYVTKTLLKASCVDIQVAMPAQFFDKEDYLNERYYVKRALYLCELAHHLQFMNQIVDKVKFSFEDGDNLRPNLEITPVGKLGKKISFLLHLAPEESSFRLNRFIPSRNNVRSRWFFDNKSEDAEDQSPTPVYNNGVLRDLRSAANENFLTQLIECNCQLRDAIILLKVWARQRDLHCGYGAFNGHVWTFLVAYLLQIRKINATMSSYQVVRAIWNYLSVADWTESGITMCNSSAEHQPSMADFHANFSLVFVDPSGFLNLCGGMCPSLFRRCKDEAVLAVKNLDTPDINCFHVLFMVPVPFSRLCDQTIIIYNWAAMEKIVQEQSSMETKLSYCGVTYPQARHITLALLAKALGERVSRIFVGPTARKSWAIDKKPRTAAMLKIGLLLDPENCFNLVDKGPSADAVEAEDFRSFWKNRSELRRFKDGSITESVMWKGKTWVEKRMICRQVTQFVVEAKLGLVPADYRHTGDELVCILPSGWETTTSLIHTALENLTKDLRGLKGLPLDVISTQGSSPVFRWSEVFPPDRPANLKQKVYGVVGTCTLVNPKAHMAPPWCAAAEVIIQLGSSNKWPRELEAVRRIRAAFNIKIAQLLSTTCGYVTHPFLDWVDVLKDTCVFRLRIVYPGEVGLMKKLSAPDGMVMYRDNEESLNLEKIAVLRPKLTSALNGLQSQYNSYGAACCLAKRWIRAHMVHPSHMGDEAIDLLMAALYVNPAPWLPPNQPQLAFLRFIALLAFTDWNIESIVLNFNDVLTRDEKLEIQSHFEQQRRTLPSLFIATPDDRLRSLWTRSGPSAVVLHRLSELANRTLDFLQNRLNNPQEVLDIPMIFKPSLGVFDVVIHLVKGNVPKRHQCMIGEKCVEEKEEKEPPHLTKVNPCLPVVQFDPPEFYITELEESYGEWALFFYDSYGGSSIGVLWKPTCKAPREFKVSHLHGRYLDPTTKMLHVNVDAILEGFHVLGNGLVKLIQVKKDDKLIDLHF